MRARELAGWFPIVSLATDALTAARTMGDQRHPGFIVCDGDGQPHTVLPGTRCSGLVIPPPCRTILRWPARTTNAGRTSC